ncbi:MAG: peptide deformylase [Deltaproteobacteria bacterium]|jgi:peptide deformylase|nr:peptide deformylase [Deltaproteobacteria bacterium]
MKLDVLKYPDARLRLKSAPVERITEEICRLAEDMVETMYAEDGIGLAAPQVGRPLRLVVVDLSGPSRREAATVYVNPELEILGEETQESEEGCLSVPDLRAVVKRGARVRIKALNLRGEELVEEADGVRAICLQHECEHLEGRLFLDRLSRLKRNLYNIKRKKILTGDDA